MLQYLPLHRTWYFIIWHYEQFCQTSFLPPATAKADSTHPSWKGNRRSRARPPHHGQDDLQQHEAQPAKLREGEHHLVPRVGGHIDHGGDDGRLHGNPCVVAGARRSPLVAVVRLPVDGDQQEPPSRVGTETTTTADGENNRGRRRQWQKCIRYPSVLNNELHHKESQILVTGKSSKKSYFLFLWFLLVRVLDLRDSDHPFVPFRRQDAQLLKTLHIRCRPCLCSCAKFMGWETILYLWEIDRWEKRPSSNSCSLAHRSLQMPINEPMVYFIISMRSYYWNSAEIRGSKSARFCPNTLANKA